MPVRMRRVLVLRAGLGPAPRHSRAGVAGLLDLSVHQVTRIERRGVRRLQMLERRTGCANSAAPRVTTILAEAGLPVTRAPLFPAATTSSAPSSDPGGDARSDPAKPASSDSSDLSAGSGSVLGETEANSPPAAVAPLAQPGDGDYTFAVMALALLVAVAAGVVAVRREVS